MGCGALYAGCLTIRSFALAIQTYLGCTLNHNGVEKTQTNVASLKTSKIAQIACGTLVLMIGMMRLLALSLVYL